jgi:iron complex transport system substrate-binding protein
VGGSFLSEVVDAAGGVNVFADDARPSPQVSREEILRRGADAVLVSPGGARRLAADPGWRGLTAVRAGRVLAFDTALVQRPSVQLGQAAVMLARLLHPDVVVAGGATGSRR